MGATLAVYAGSFDPVTFGHIEIVRRAARIFDRVVFALGENPSKRYLLSKDTRQEIMRSSVADLENVSVDCYGGLLIDYCKSIGANVIVRGLRAVTDFEFEFQIGLANRDLAPEIETVFLIPAPRHIFVSSSLIKEIFLMGGDVSAYVPAASLEALVKARGSAPA